MKRTRLFRASTWFGPLLLAGPVLWWGALLSRSSAEPPQVPPAAREAAPPVAEVDRPQDPPPEPEATLGESLKLRHPHGLLRIARDTYGLALGLENVGEDPVSGPVFVVIESTGIASLPAPKDPIRLLGEREELEPGRTSRPKSVKLQTDGAALDVAERDQLDLKYRFVRDAAAADAGASGRPEKGDALAKKYGLPAGSKTFPGKGYGPAELEQVVAAQNAASANLLKLDGVQGLGVSEVDGRPAITVYVYRAGAGKNVPPKVGDTPTTVKVIAPPFAGPAAPAPQRVGGRLVPEATIQTTDPTTRLRPAPIGTSTSIQELGCYSGTIGFLARDASDRLVAISNAHVWGLGSSPGYHPVEPSKGDNGCNAPDTNRIATYEKHAPITFSYFASNTIDAAQALVTPGEMTAKTPDDVYGYPATQTVAASPGLKVKKYGRTTSLTHGQVSAVNVTINVNYGGSYGVARFVNQVQYQSLDSSAFTAAGDSGSLIVTETDKKPVALNFAGGGGYGYGNPVGPILSYFGLTLADKDYGGTGGGGGGGGGGTPTTALVRVRTWNDADRDGIQDAGETDLSGVQVRIYDRTTGVWTSATSSGGHAQFTVTPNRDFYFRVTRPSGYSVSPRNRTSDDLDSDFRSNGDIDGWKRITADYDLVDCGFYR